jgi:predicted nicotinamide N-methyase
VRTDHKYSAASSAPVTPLQKLPTKRCRCSAVGLHRKPASFAAHKLHVVLDLPQIYTKPSADAILETLALLTSAPPSWDYTSDHAANDGANPDTQKDTKPRAVQIDPEGVTRYLTSIVSNSLRWIQDEEVKEEIWNQASLRLSERSGRTARGDLTRRFTIPTSDGSFELSIHEPALTGDDLGLKTWAASYLLAKRLHSLQLVPPGQPKKSRVLELGSGTGLVGLAMAGLGADVVMTDLPSIYANLARNAEANAAVLEQAGGSVRTGVLDWTNPRSCTLFPKGVFDTSSDREVLREKFPLILAADSLYSPDHPRMLVESIATWLSEDVGARVIVEFPYRDAYLPEIANFRERMTAVGLQILDEGEEKGYDDWGDACKDDDALVTCWWSCWGRKLPEQSP